MERKMKNTTKIELTAHHLNIWLWEVAEESGYLVTEKSGGFYLTDPTEDVHGPFSQLSQLVDFMDTSLWVGEGLREELEEEFSF